MGQEETKFRRDGETKFKREEETQNFLALRPRRFSGLFPLICVFELLFFPALLCASVTLW